MTGVRVIPDSARAISDLIADQSLDAPGFEAAARGVMRLALSDVHSAVALGDQLIDCAGHDPERQILALVARAHARAYAGGLEDAVEGLRQAAALCEEAGLGSRRGLVAGAMVQPLLRLGRTHEACEAAERAVAASSEPIEEAKALVSLGAVLRMLGQRSRAISALERAGVLAEGSDAIRAAARSNLAECLLDEDRCDEAVEGFGQAATAFDSAGRPHAAAICRGNIADVLGRLGRVDEASAAFEGARRSFQASGAPLDVARLHIEEGEMLAQAGALRMARDRTAFALPILEQAGAEAELIRARAALGLVLLRLGDPAGARDALGWAQSRPGHAEMPGMRAEIVLGLAWCDLMESDASAAAQRADTVLSMDGLSRSVRVRALLARGESALLRGHRDRAAADARTAVEIAVSGGLRSIVPLCQELLGRSLEAPDLALEALVRGASCAIEVLEAARSEAGAGGLRHLYTPLIARAASRLAAGADGASDALMLLERSARRSVRRPARDGDAEQERIEAALARAYARAGAFGLHAEDQGSLRRLELEAQILRENAGSSGALPMIATPDSRAMSLRMPTSDAFVRFWASEDRVHALVLSHEGTRTALDLAALSACLSGARRLSFLAERASEPTMAGVWIEQARALGSLLFGRVRELFPGFDRLFVGAGPELEGLPWNLLGAVTLGADVGVCLVRSISDAIDLRGPGVDPVVLALAPREESLPHAPGECERVAGIWNGRVLIGGSTASALDAIGRADVVHLATHGVFVPDRPGASRVLIGDGWIPMATLAARVRPGALIVLAACHAGRAGGLAEDRAALPRVLLDAGAGAVIAPLWPLADASAGEFAAGLHIRMRDGWSIAGGLARAVGASVLDAATNRTGTADAAGVVLTGGAWC